MVSNDRPRKLLIAALESIIYFIAFTQHHRLANTFPLDRLKWKMVPRFTSRLTLFPLIPFAGSIKRALN